MVEALILDLLEWIGPTPRSYDEILDAWRTSCPRLPVWEEANDRHFVTAHHEAGQGRLISVSLVGWAHLRAHRQSVGNSKRSRRRPHRESLIHPHRWPTTNHRWGAVIWIEAGPRYGAPIGRPRTAAKTCWYRLPRLTSTGSTPRVASATMGRIRAFFVVVEFVVGASFGVKAMPTQIWNSLPR